MVERVLQLNREKTVFWTLLGVLFLCAGFYMFFINSTIHNVVARQNFENEASTLNLKISNQEFEYITKRNAVTLTMAYSVGFKDADVNAYVSRGNHSSVALLVR